MNRIAVQHSIVIWNLLNFALVKFALKLKRSVYYTLIEHPNSLITPIITLAIARVIIAIIALAIARAIIDSNRTRYRSSDYWCNQTSYRSSNY